MNTFNLFMIIIGTFATLFFSTLALEKYFDYLNEEKIINSFAKLKPSIIYIALSIIIFCVPGIIGYGNTPSLFSAFLAFPVAIASPIIASFISNIKFYLILSELTKNNIEIKEDKSPEGKPFFSLYQNEILLAITTKQELTNTWKNYLKTPN